ncbi:MAG: DUF423 domain-containing protein [Kofleriaceae bacterium]
MNDRSPLIALGAINAALSVAAGAFGAHGLRERLEPRALEVFETAARYHMYHALGIILCGVIATTGGPRGASTAGWILQAGIMVFSGSLYALALTGVNGLGAVTPLGGLAFLVGWIWLAWTTLRK